MRQLADTVDLLKGEMQALEEEGNAYKPGNSTAEAVAAENQLAAAEAKRIDMQNRLGTSMNYIVDQVDEYNQETSKMAVVTEKVKSAFSKLGNAIKRVAKLTGSGVIGGLKKLSAGILGIHKTANKSTYSMGMMIKNALVMGALYKVISGVSSAVKSGFENLAQYSGSTNNSISMLWSSLERLKNSFATAFAPILNVVAPILTKFINMISTAVSYVGAFFSALTGKSTYTSLFPLYVGDMPPVIKSHFCVIDDFPVNLFLDPHTWKLHQKPRITVFLYRFRDLRYCVHYAHLLPVRLSFGLDVLPYQ